MQLSMNINLEIVVSWPFQEVRGVRLDSVNDPVPSSTLIWVLIHWDLFKTKQIACTLNNKSLMIHDIFTQKITMDETFDHFLCSVPSQ